MIRHKIIRNLQISKSGHGVIMQGSGFKVTNRWLDLGGTVKKCWVDGRPRTADRRRPLWIVAADYCSMQ
ncbi:MAG: hypothetical protein DI535_06385 [Citrobacter freundii]|nr:MAG: hypothetical protein DI535_06385 [Citrobacter freundii]